jgi:hypothetical protein
MACHCRSGAHARRCGRPATKEAPRKKEPLTTSSADSRTRATTVRERFAQLRPWLLPNEPTVLSRRTATAPVPLCRVQPLGPQLGGGAGVGPVSAPFRRPCACGELGTRAAVDGGQPRRRPRRRRRASCTLWCGTSSTTRTPEASRSCRRSCRTPSWPPCSRRPSEWLLRAPSSRQARL